MPSRPRSSWRLNATPSASRWKKSTLPSTGCETFSVAVLRMHVACRMSTHARISVTDAGNSRDPVDHEPRLIEESTIPRSDPGAGWGTGGKKLHIERATQCGRCTSTDRPAASLCFVARATSLPQRSGNLGMFGKQRKFLRAGCRRGFPAEKPAWQLFSHRFSPPSGPSHPVDDGDGTPANPT
jgi:hypothetical protein